MEVGRHSENVGRMLFPNAHRSERVDSKVGGSSRAGADKPARKDVKRRSSYTAKTHLQQQELQQDNLAMPLGNRQFHSPPPTIPFSTPSRQPKHPSGSHSKQFQKADDQSDKKSQPPILPQHVELGGLIDRPRDFDDSEATPFSDSVENELRAHMEAQHRLHRELEGQRQRTMLLLQQIVAARNERVEEEQKDGAGGRSEGASCRERV